MTDDDIKRARARCGVTSRQLGFSPCVSRVGHGGMHNFRPWSVVTDLQDDNDRLRAQLAAVTAERDRLRAVLAAVDRAWRERGIYLEEVVRDALGERT